MKKTLIITAIALATTTGMTFNAVARGPNFDPANCPAAADGMGYGCGSGYHRGGGMMMNDINLTDAQKAQIRDIVAQQREETHAKIRAILTPEQQTAFDARKQQRDTWFEQRKNQRRQPQ